MRNLTKFEYEEEYGRDYDYDPTPEMVCTSCHEECKPKKYDYSFGHEFGTYRDIRTYSDCCEAEMIAGGPLRAPAW